jgi:hypothetical protein
MRNKFNENKTISVLVVLRLLCLEKILQHSQRPPGFYFVSLRSTFLRSPHLTFCFSLLAHTMSKNLIVLTTENISLLSGSISYEKSSDAPTVATPVYVVIVDDNSGSMSGGRANNCALKTKAIIHECVAKGVSYQYAT